MSYQYPLAHIDGFDISLDQSPPGEWLPENVSTQQLDIHEPLPERLVGKYDLVNIRLLLAVVRDNNPESIANSVVKMLSASVLFLCAPED